MLVDLVGMKKGTLAKKFGVTPTTIGNWCKAAPQYAVFAMQLLLDLKAKEEELKRAYELVSEYTRLKKSQNEITNKALDLIRAANPGE